MLGTHFLATKNTFETVTKFDMFGEYISCGSKLDLFKKYILRKISSIESFIFEFFEKQNNILKLVGFEGAPKI